MDNPVISEASDVVSLVADRYPRTTAVWSQGAKMFMQRGCFNISGGDKEDFCPLFHLVHFFRTSARKPRHNAFTF